MCRPPTPTSSLTASRLDDQPQLDRAGSRTAVHSKPGCCVLTAFLLTLPYSDKFDTIDSVQRIAYLLVLTGAIATTAVVMSPIAYHRILSRRGRRPWLVATANRLARTALALVALTTSGVVFLTVDLTVGRISAAVASLVALIGYLVLWVGVPLRARP